jgi:hypothetical protein
MYDATANYRTPFLILCALLLVSLPLMLTLQSPARFAANTRLRQARIRHPDAFARH